MIANTLTFEGIPDKHSMAFADGVLETLGKLGFDFDYDEFSPADGSGDLTYKVAGVKPPRGWVDIENDGLTFKSADTDKGE